MEGQSEVRGKRKARWGEKEQKEMATRRRRGKREKEGKSVGKRKKRQEGYVGTEQRERLRGDGD